MGMSISSSLSSSLHHPRPHPHPHPGWPHPQVEHLAQASQRRQAQLRDLQSQVDRLTTLCRISAEECRQGCGAAVPARLRRPAARAANRLLDYTSQLCNQGWPGRLAPGLPAYRPLLAPPDAAGPNAAGPALPACRKLKDRAEQAAPMSDELAAAWEAAALPDEEAGLQDLIAEKVCWLGLAGRGWWAVVECA